MDQQNQEAMHRTHFLKGTRW